jgi:hypothetical protein
MLMAVLERADTGKGSAKKRGGEITCLLIANVPEYRKRGTTRGACLMSQCCENCCGVMAGLRWSSASLMVLVSMGEVAWWT